MKKRFPLPVGQFLFLALVSCTCLSGTGCVERLLQVRSEPPGATVYVNGAEVGKTPCDHAFSFYGTVDVTLRAPGYLSQRELHVLSPPWYEIFPADFVAEILLPFHFQDVHQVTVKLAPSPQEMSPGQQRELREKAEEMRSRLEPSKKESSPSD